MCRHCNILILLILWCSPLITAAQKTIGTGPIRKKAGLRKALLIGNKSYEIGPLENTERDVDSMAVTLAKLGFDIVSYKNISYRDTQLAIEKFQNGLSGDNTEIVIFYFSGHGLGYGETNYLLPVDTRLNCLDELKSYEALSLNRIVEGILSKGIRHNYFFIDACRDLPRRLMHCDGSPPQTAHGLVKPLNKITGSVISFATNFGETADDDTYDKVNSLFTSELIKYLPTRNVTMIDVIGMVKAGVNLRSGKRQNPQHWEDVLDKYVLVSTSRGVISPGSLTNEPVMPKAAKKISVMAFKPGGNEPDFEVIQMTMKSLEEKFPGYEISQQMNEKSLSDNSILCTVTRRTETERNPLTVNNETFELIKAQSKLNVKFKQGNDLKGEVELSDKATDQDMDQAIRNSIKDSLKKLKDVMIRLD